ncbi:chemotaxis protein CheD [Chlorobium sp. N1]|uniref:chemotaxis protein CheD n=1 Tax=Chlorobium sp. N1 TaxID=2491138 RepID=UPI0013F154BF|nr:chemotaxis protein CheD [Chlorobium sp. N1]
MMIQPQQTVVYTGEVATTRSGEILISSPLGSCIAICAYCPGNRVGGLAHVMLPGHPPSAATTDRNRYAGHALKTLLNDMREKGAEPETLRVCLIGGANVLKREHDTIHIDNLHSLTAILENAGIPVCCSSTGGFERMIARLDTQNGILFQSIGNSPETRLFDFHSTH